MAEGRAPTKGERIAAEKLRVHMAALEIDRWDYHALEELVPDAWHTLAYDIDLAEPKEKVTLYLDRSVARAFKAMGHGYQARINRLLSTYLTMQAARKINFRKFWQARQEDFRNPWPLERTPDEEVALSGQRGVVV